MKSNIYSEMWSKDELIVVIVSHNVTLFQGEEFVRISFTYEKIHIEDNKFIKESQKF